METIKIEFNGYGLRDVLEHIQCEDVEYAFEKIQKYYNSEWIRIINLRHVMECLDNFGLDYITLDEDDDENEDLYVSAIDIAE
jgi:hypothetical protein